MISIIFNPIIALQNRTFAQPGTTGNLHTVGNVAPSVAIGIALKEKKNVD